MVRSIAKVLFLAVLVAAGSVGIVYYRDNFSSDRKIEQLEQDKRQLQQIVKRLSDERRVAKVLVTDQRQVNGIQQTTLLFEEYSRDGSKLPPKLFTIEGNEAHIDALVIKFDHDLVEKDDPLRGHSIALFVKLFGDHQSPDHAFPIDEPGKVPAFYRDSDQEASQFEQELWTNFWKLADDPAYRQSKGVRIANPESPWGPFEPGNIYTISLEANGGLNMTHEPVEGIYLDAMKRRGGE